MGHKMGHKMGHDSTFLQMGQVTVGWANLSWGPPSSAFNALEDCSKGRKVSAEASGGSDSIKYNIFFCSVAVCMMYVSSKIQS